MKIELINDGCTEVNIVYSGGRTAQFQAETHDEGIQQEVYFSIDVLEAEQMIEGFRKFISLTEDPKCPECLNTVSQEELNVFGGMCEDCAPELD